MILPSTIRLGRVWSGHAVGVTSLRQNRRACGSGRAAAAARRGASAFALASTLHPGAAPDTTLENATCFSSASSITCV
jgi:hypothetical protein